MIFKLAKAQHLFLVFICNKVFGCELLQVVVADTMNERELLMHCVILHCVIFIPISILLHYVLNSGTSFHIISLHIINYFSSYIL